MADIIKTKLRPLAGYVLILPLDEEETTASGLVMPEKEKEKPAKGKVIAVGADLPRFESGVTYIKELDRHKVANEMPQVKVGNIVIFHRWSGQDVKEGQKEYKLVKFSDLVGVYEDD